MDEDKQQLKCNIKGCGLLLADLQYQKQVNKTQHLVGKCPEHGVRYLPYMGGLDIPVVLTKEARKTKEKESQQNLF